MLWRAITLWLLALALAPGAALAQPAPPSLDAPVNDHARVIDAASAAELTRRIRALQAATGDAVVVATVPTFQPYGDIREFAGKMFQNGGRGIGDKGKDNGLLIVVAVQDRRVDVEVGYALEEFITDGFAGETIRNDITPPFRSGNYGAGLLAGTTRIINRIAERRGVNLQDVPANPQPVGGASPRLPFGMILFWIVIAIFFSRRGRGRRRRHWGGGPWSGWSSGIGPFGGGSGFGGGFGGFGSGGGFGGGGGGFGGFGGGRSGGGGASGGW